jgi:magnesium-transporting ATPase (P-type)
VNLIIAIGCSIPLIWEIKEKGLLDRPPRDPNEKLFNAVFIRKVLIVSFVSALSVFGLFLAFTNGSGGIEISDLVLSQAQTVAFTTLIMVQLAYLFTARSIDRSAFTFSPFSNKYLVIGAGVTLGLQLIIVYADSLFGFSPFRTAPFPAIWWVPIILVSVACFLAVELEKWVVNRITASKKPGAAKGRFSK